MSPRPRDEGPRPVTRLTGGRGVLSERGDISYFIITVKVRARERKWDGVGAKL